MRHKRLFGVVLLILYLVYTYFFGPLLSIDVNGDIAMLSRVFSYSHVRFLKPLTSPFFCTDNWTDPSEWLHWAPKLEFVLNYRRYKDFFFLLS